MQSSATAGAVINGESLELKVKDERKDLMCIMHISQEP